MAINAERTDIQLITPNQRAGIPNIKDPEANNVDSEDDDDCSLATQACHLRKMTPTNIDPKKSVRWDDLWLGSLKGNEYYDSTEVNMATKRCIYQWTCPRGREVAFFSF